MSKALPWMGHQGDVFFEAIEEEEFNRLAIGATPVPDKILAYGEATGHAHKVVGNVDVLKAAENILLMKVNEDAKLIHTAGDRHHGTVPLEKERKYVKATLQTENNPYTDAARRVQD